MSYRKIFWGVLLVLTGILFILKNTGVLMFSWHTFWNLWPVILILWGISLVPVKDWIKLVLSVLTLVVTFFVVQKYAPAERHRWNWEWNSENKDNKDNKDSQDSDSTAPMGNLMTEDYDSLTKAARLNLNIGVGNFTMKEATAYLIEVSHDNDNASYSMTTRNEDSLSIVNISLEKSEFNDTRMNNDVHIKLNPNPVWDMDLKVGAAEVDFDLSGYKTRSIKIEGGASDIDLKVAATQPESEIRVKAGAASIRIRIPESAGAEIVSNTVLASKEFKGFTKTGNQQYRTPNFASSANKIKINFEAGLSSVEVVRY